MTSIGVVIPTRDRAALLRRAVSSVGAADQVVVVDDGSTTYTAELITELQADGAEFIRLPTSRGPGVARNLGVQALRTEVAFFLDDDDFVLEGGIERIRSLAERHPEHVLFLHNCRFSDGRTSLEPSARTLDLSFDAWVRLMVESARTEYKPAARVSLFERDRFDDTGASGEGLLWARTIRAHGALLSHEPVVFYDVDPHRPRLTSQSELLARAPANARIARAWLEEVGPATRQIAQGAWERLVLSAALYSRLAGDRFDAVAAAGPLTPRLTVAIRLVRLLPRPLLSAVIRARQVIRP